MPQPLVQIQTPLGNVGFLVESADPILELSIQAAPFQPKIPPGMSVLACYGVVLKINAPNTVNDLRFTALLESTSIVGSGPSTGEGLEALDWKTQNHVM